MTARFRDLDEILHELQRLFGAVIRSGIAVFEYTRQTRHSCSRHVAVRAPDNVLSLALWAHHHDFDPEDDLGGGGAGPGFPL